MTDREIRYCTTPEDGARIAYCVEGDGPTTILALQAFNESFALDHLMPVFQQFYRDLGAGRRIIRYDFRGTGLSADVPDNALPLTLERGLADLVAISRAVGTKVVVWAPTNSGPTAIAFAIAHPELVRHLILYDTYCTLTDALPASTADAFGELALADWEMAAQTIADTNGRREFPAEAAQLGEWYFRSESAERYNARTLAFRSSPRPTPDLSRVGVPTLVLHRIADPIIRFSAGQKLAASIPNARFTPLEGKGHLFCLGDYSNILAAVDSFLGDRATPVGVAAPPTPVSPGAFRTILFTDIVGHTEMMQRLGDERGRDVLREHERITRDLLKQHSGAEVKTMGDGFMASFSSVTAAMDCAIALQRAFLRPLISDLPAPVQIRIGLNAGEPIEEDGVLFGAPVILASRIAAKAAAGEILIPETLRHLMSGKSYVYADRGETMLKGFEDAVRLYEVRWNE